MKGINRRVSRWAAALTALLCLAPVCATAARDAGLSLHTLVHDGRERSYYLHLPAGAARPERRPVVIVLHGGGRTAGDDLARRTGYNRIADREGFIAVYPNGVGARWNDGRGPTFRQGRESAAVDDVGFIAGLIDAVLRRYRGDPRRVYVTGLSNGGMMTLRLGCELGRRLAAIAPVIAAMPLEVLRSCRPDAPLPVLVMNGTGDPLVPWAGGAVSILRQSRGEVASTPETVRFWVAHNHCRPVPTLTRLPDRDARDGSRVEVIRYTNPDNGCEVILYRVDGGGHHFPGSDTPELPRLLGRKNNDFDGAEAIWAFFRRHERP